MRRRSSSHVSRNTWNERLRRAMSGASGSIAAGLEGNTIPKPDGLAEPATTAKSNRDRTRIGQHSTLFECCPTIRMSQALSQDRLRRSRGIRSRMESYLVFGI
jgi:hypothetical protein